MNSEKSHHYDIRSLYRDFKIAVNGLFDTQLACRFLGMAETSLEAVSKRWFDVSLNKKYQRKDWSKRPLPEEMTAYAAEDVRYLIPLAQKLKLDIDPAILLTSAQINAIAAQHPFDLNRLHKINEMKNWQKKAFGNEILAILQKLN